MIKLFLYDSLKKELKINAHELLLIEEFKNLLDVDRNKTNEDKTGKLYKKAYKEFTYLFLYYDFNSPYLEYINDIKHKTALKDSGLTEDDLKDSIFKAASEKYQEILNSSRILSLIHTALRTLEKLRIHIDNIDLTERDMNDKPIYKAKDVLADIASIGKMSETLLELELQYKKQESSSKGVRAGDKPGFQDY